MDFKLSLLTKQVKRSLLNGQRDISLYNILNSEQCQIILNSCSYFRDRIYTSTITLLLFIKQALSPDKSCKAAVIRLAMEGSIEEMHISTNTGAYCKSRYKLQEESVKELVKETGKLSMLKASGKWKVYGRDLKVFDGSTIRMPDTNANQNAFPQDKSQKKGCGFPIMRFLVIMSLVTGTVVDYAVDAYSGKGTGEASLLRRIFECILKDDIVLGDRYYPNYFLLSHLQKIGADGVFQGHVGRRYDFRKGERIGKKDHIVYWKKPARPDWMSIEEYAAHPDQIRVREFKVLGMVYVTTFFDNKKYHKGELAKIYKRRWEVEINLKNIKSTMGMDMLTCKSPEMVKKELGIYFLAYNLIRIIMVEACLKHNAIPWEISYKGSLQLVNELASYLINVVSFDCQRRMYDKMLSLLVKNKVGNRPGRIEPRKVKRRPKPYSLLNQPRTIEKVRLAISSKYNALRHTMP